MLAVCYIFLRKFYGYTCICLWLQGKFIRINFDMSGYIAGANIETCILILSFHF